MKRHPFSELANAAKADPVRRERIEQFTRAMEDALALAELRQELGVTQRDMAESLSVTQANVSRIEHEEDLYLSTLRGYVEALGGRLELNAVFPDRTVVIVAGSRS
jgi:predicted transcriptional regulator